MGSPAAANAAEKGFAASALVPAPFPDAATNMDMSMAIVAGSAAGAGAGAGAALIPSIAANGLYAGAGTFEGTIQGMWNDGAAGTDSAGFLGLLDIDAPASAVSPGASRRACTNATRDANVAHGSAPKTAGAPFWSTYAICSALGSYLPPAGRAAPTRSASVTCRASKLSIALRLIFRRADAPRPEAQLSGGRCAA